LTALGSPGNLVGWGWVCLNQEHAEDSGGRRLATMKAILIVADTLRRDHLGTYGNAWVHTPNLDALAAEAAVFEQHHIGSFPTVPHRRDMLLGLGDKGHPFNRWRGIDDDEVTLAERLQHSERRQEHVQGLLGLDLESRAGGRPVLAGRRRPTGVPGGATLDPVYG
jgi:hypothetical protein